MINTSDRREIVKLITEAKLPDVSQVAACDTSDIIERTFQRWTKEKGIKKMDALRQNAKNRRTA
jgi:hypothetical protein